MFNAQPTDLKAIRTDKQTERMEEGGGGGEGGGRQTNMSLRKEMGEG